MNTLKYKVIDENFVTAPGSSCKVRFLHLSNNAPNVDVNLDGQGTPMFQNYYNGLNGEYVQMGSGTRQFKALTPGAGGVLTTQNPYDYKPGAFYSLFLRGNVGATGLDSLSFFVIESTIDYL